MDRNISDNIDLAPDDGSPSGVSDYLSKLYKIIPAELTAAYLAISSFLTDPANGLANVWLLFGFGIFLTVLTPIYLTRLQGVRNPFQLVVSTVSFPIWAVCISTSVVTLAVPALTPQVITVVMVGWGARHSRARP